MIKIILTRKKYHRILLIQMLFVLMLSCSNSGNEQEVQQKINIEIQLLIQQWQSDSLGCQRIRTKIIAETIIDSLKLNSCAKSEFIKTFGNSNTENERNGSVILGYYFDSICNNGRFIDSADYCIAEFTFSLDKLVQRNYICR